MIRLIRLILPTGASRIRIQCSICSRAQLEVEIGRYWGEGAGRGSFLRFLLYIRDYPFHGLHLLRGAVGSGQLAVDS